MARIFRELSATSVPNPNLTDEDFASMPMHLRLDYLAAIAQEERENMTEQERITLRIEEEYGN